MYLLSVFGGGLWIIPVGLFLGALLSFYRAYKSSKSNSHSQDRQGYHDNLGNMSFTSRPQFWFGVALVVFTIVSIAMMIADK